MGTSTGANNAHLALAEPTNKLMVAPNRIIKANRIESGRFDPSKNAGRLIANIYPRFDQLNMATKCAAVNASTK